MRDLLSIDYAGKCECRIAVAFWSTGASRVTDITTLRHRLARRVEELTAQSALSIDQLAARAKLPPSRVQQILRSDSSCVTLREMSALADVLGTPLADLLAPAATRRVVTIEEIEQG